MASDLTENWHWEHQPFMNAVQLLGGTLGNREIARLTEGPLTGWWVHIHADAPLEPVHVGPFPSLVAAQEACLREVRVLEVEARLLGLQVVA